MLTSCQNEDLGYKSQTSNSDSEKPQIPFESIPFNENGKLKLKFAKAFSNALIANKDLRTLIKDEALKKFDKDYDVLYLSVKNKNLKPSEYLKESSSKTSKNLLHKSANATTFREALLPFFDSEAELIEIEQKLPLLTIFVPDLPLGYFSAATWDVNDETQIPDVALRLTNTNDIPVIGKDGSKYVIEAELTPGFPIVVIKENERVRIVNKKSKSKQNYKKAIIDEDVEFIDDNFDPNVSVNTTPQIVTNSGLDQRVIDAYNIWNNNDGWQRDYIYYGLTTTNTTGELTRNYSEHITSFRLTGDPKVAFTYIASGSTPDNLDPQQVNEYRLGGSGWTDGAFEFNVYCYFGSKPNTTGESDIKRFGLKPDDLFLMNHTKFTRGSWFLKKTYFRTEIVAPKQIDFLDPKYDITLPLVVWDLSKYGADWDFKFEEFDTSMEQNISESKSTKITANVNGELGADVFKIIKVGLKWGVSKEVTKTNTYNLKFTTTSNPLGSSIVSFYDNAVNKSPTSGVLIPRAYSTGRVEFSIMPIRVQW